MFQLRLLIRHAVPSLSSPSYCHPSHPLLSEVSPCLPSSSGIHRHVFECVESSCKQQAHSSFAEQHGCLPPPRIQNQRPWGLDRIEQIFRADKEWRLMELFLFHFRQTGNTVEQDFLGTPAFATIEPANLEALLSTKFKGN